MKISFNRPFIAGKELFYISQSVLSGHISGDGIFTKKCTALMEDKFKAKKVFLTTSCTAALEMAAILCGVTTGDEVILPSFTFVSPPRMPFIYVVPSLFSSISGQTRLI